MRVKSSSAEQRQTVNDDTRSFVQTIAYPRDLLRVNIDLSLLIGLLVTGECNSEPRGMELLQLLD